MKRVVFLAMVLFVAACGQQQPGAIPQQPPIVGGQPGISSWATALPRLLDNCTVFYAQAYGFAAPKSTAICTCYYQRGQAAFPDYNVWRNGGEVRFFNDTNAKVNDVYDTCIYPNIR